MKVCESIPTISTIEIKEEVDNSTKAGGFEKHVNHSKKSKFFSEKQSILVDGN